MSKRNIPTAIEKLLVSNEPFEYAHLVKYERPFDPKDGEFRNNEKRYVYLTDGARDVDYHGITYVANRLVTVGGYSETTEARATNMSLTLSGEPIGLTYNVTAALTSSGSVGTLTGDANTNVDGHVIDFVDAGFIEGDAVKVQKANGTAFSDGDTSKVFVIKTFSNENKTFTFERTGSDSDDSAFITLSNTNLKLTLDSAEVKGPLLDTGGAAPSFLNREVFIYKVFFDANDPSSFVGGGSEATDRVLVFKGIISATNIQEAPTSSKVQWNLTSHWGDFEQVSGRITTDEIHRALDATGKANEKATIRPEYSRDLGFLHAESSLNTIATYQTSETRYKYKTKKKFFKTKIKEQPYEHISDHDVDLSVFLSGKYLPVLYGVNRVPGVPIFADTSNDNAKEVYVAYAISEGENHGLYNLYIDGAPLICVDKADSDVRSTEAANSDSQALQCYGRMDQGATLGGQHNSGTTTTMDDCEDILEGNSVNTVSEKAWEAYAVCVENTYESVTEPTNAIVADDNALGLQHNEYAQISHPYDMRLGFHTGRAAQAADNMLVTKAANNGFKRQNDYYSGNERYWGPDHRLLDTSYAVIKFSIDADTTTVPEVEYVVKGKVLENYNYDGTFVHDAVLGGSDNHADFKEGDSVTVEASLDGSTWSTISGSYRILDKYNFETARGTSHYRFRLSTVPDLTYVNGVPTFKWVRLKSGSDYWHMLTYNNNIVEEAAWSSVSSANTISASSVAVVNNKLEFTLDNTNETKLQNLYSTISNSGTTSRALVQFSGSGITGDFKDLATSTRQPLLNTSTNKVVINNLNYSGSSTPSNINLTPATVFDFSNIAKVAAVTNTAEIVGCILEIIETGEEREITGFNASTNMVTIFSPFITPPSSGHTFNIKGRGSDKRSSINPAIQTIDILTSKLYGKGLSVNTDIALDTVKTAALICDTRSDVSLSLASGTTVKQNDIYKITKADGTHLASGRVTADVTNGTVIKFDEVSGKFLRGYQNYIKYNVGDILYQTVSGVQRFYRVTVAGYKNTVPSHTTGTTNGLQHISAPALTKVSGNGSSPASITLASNGTIPLYSLYDSDFVKYWRYLGWEENRQWCVTRHQTNGMMDTAKSVFSNLNAILSQYNGMLSYANGKYELGVETNQIAPVESNSFDSTTYDWNVNPEFIEESDIIGTINLNDNSQKNSKNTVKGSIFDPQNNFQSRSITFYNSDFVKADRNIIKTGNITLPAVTSYYNARMTIEKYLLESRFSKEISFTVGQKGLLLKPGQVISLNYEPFGFEGKLFRVSNLNYQNNCTVSIKATEYDDSFYIITPQRASKAQQATLSQREGVAYPGVPTLGNPTTTKPGVITLSWTNGVDFSESTDSTQIWRATSQGSSGNVTDHATLITTVDNTTSWADAVGQAGTFYYWIRHVRKTRRKSDNSTQLIFKEEFSTAINAGKQGVAKVSSPQLDIDISSIQIKFNDSGVLTPTGTAQDVKLTATLRNITPASGVVFSIIDADQSSQTDVQFTNGATSLTDTSAPYEATLDASSASNATTNKFVKAVVTDTSGEVFTELVPVSVTKDGSSGSTGVAAAAIDLSPSTSVITYSANDPDSENPSTTINFTTSLQGNTGDATSAFAGTPYYEFIVDGTTKQNSTTSTFTLADTDEPADQETVQVQVKARDGGTTGAIKATDSVTIFGIKSGSDAVTAFLTNTAHTVSADTDGSLASGALDNAGGTFKVFVGSTDRTTSCNFSEVSGQETSGLTSSINSSTGVYTISGLTVDIAKNVFRATIPASISPTGVQMTIDQTYSISKSRNGLVGSNGNNAKTVKLTSDKYAIAYNAAGTSPNPSSAFNLTASTQGFEDPYFKFTGDGITNETSFTDGNNSGAIDPSDTFSFSPPSGFFATPKILKVEVTEAADTSTIIASDSIAIYAVQPGASGSDGDDAFTVICTNESHAIPADADGTNPVMTGSGTTFQVFKGNTQLTGITSGTPNATQFKVTVNSDTNITVGSQSASSNNIVFADHSSLTSDTADILYTVNITNTQSVLKKQSFSRTNKGTKGDDGDPGTAALSGLLTNESFTASTFSFFTATSFINYFGGGGDFKIFQGTSELTSSLTFGISGGTVGATTVTKTQNGLTMTINKTTGVYSVAGQSWTSDTESFTLTGTSGSTTINKVYNINKAGLLGKTELTASAQAFNYDGASANPSPSSITLTASAPGFLATYGTYSYRFSKSTDGGSSYSQVQAYSSTNTLSISAGNYSTGNEVYKVEVKGGNYSSNVIDEDTITILRLKDGATGPQGNNDPRSAYIQIFNPSNSVAAITAPTDTTSGTPYNFETGILTIGSGGTSGWTQTRPTTFPYWFSMVKIAESSYEGAQNVDYQAVRRLGGIGIRDENDLDLDITDERIRFRFDTGSYTNSGTLPGSVKNESIAINTDGELTGIGTGVNTIISNTKIVEADIVGPSKTFTGGKPNKTEFQSGTTDGAIQLKNDGATNFTNLTPFSTTELQKLTNLRAGKVPGTGSGATTASIANEDIAINATTGVITGVTGDGISIRNDKTTKANVGLNLVPNVDATNASNIASGTIPIARTPTTVRNATIEVDADGKLTGIGTADIKVNNAKTTFAELNGAKPPSDANKVDITSGTDGRISVDVNGAGASNIAAFSTADRQKLTNLRAGKVPGDGSGATTALIGNDEIAINTTTGVLSGIGTGAGSRVFNDVIGITMDTSGSNQGRITIAGVGSTNTTVDVTKSNLGLSYDDGATVGAVIGTNMFDTNGSTALGVNDLKNGSIGLAADGSLTNIGTSQSLSNAKISINAAGALSGAGGGQVTAGGLGAETLELLTGGTKTVTITGNKISASGTSGWNTHVYSKDGYPAAQVSFVVPQTNKAMMIGLNNDPATNTSYSSIDYAWYIKNNGQLSIYESGSQVSTHGSYAADDKFTVTYDGSAIRYYHNGDLERTVTVRITNNLHMDSSFHDSISVIQKVQFSAITSNYWSDQGGRPTELTDGRVGTALNASGVVLTTIPEAQGGTGLTSAGTAIQNSEVTIAKDGNGTISLTNANSATISLDNADVGLGAVTNHAQIKDDLSNLNVTSADLEVADISGTKTLRAKDALKNSQITTKADGTLRYDGVAAIAPSLASIAGTVPRTKGGFGLNIDTLLGTGTGKLPRWDGSTWQANNETDFKNDQIIDSSGNIKDTISYSLPGTTDVFSPLEFKNLRLQFDNLNSTTVPVKVIGSSLPISDTIFEIDDTTDELLVKPGGIGGTEISTTTTISAGSGSNAAHLDGTGTIRIYAGSTTGNKANAPFRVTQAGALSATSTTLGSTSGVALNVSTGSKTVQINTPSSSSGTVFQAGGDATTSYVPLKVLGDGSGVIRGFDIFTSDGTKVFDKASGLTDAAITVVAQATGSAVSTISKTTNSENAADAQKITNGASSQNVTVKLTKDGDGMIGFSTTSGTVAANQIPTTVVVKLFKSANADLSSPTQIGSTRTLTKTGTQSSIATNTFFVDVESESEPGFDFHFATVPSSNSSSSSSTPFDASGNIVLEATDSLSANQVVYYFTEITGSAGNGAGSNNVTSSATRSITVTAATGNTFTIDESGDSTGSTAEGDITAVVAGTGMTGGATSGSATLNVVGGDGITANADEIEVAVDNTTIELSATSGSGTVRAKTAAIADSGTALATADQIHTFVTGQGFVTSSGVTAVVAGTGMTGGATSGSATLNVIGGDGITANADDIAVDSTVIRTTGNQTIGGTKTFSGSIDVDGIIDNTYNNGNVAAPSNSDHTAGTRIKFYDASTTAWYAMGIESNTLWFNSDNKYKWYEDSTIRMTLDGANLSVTGTISTGSFTLPNSIGSAGQVLKVPSSGTTLEWASDNSGSGGGSGLPSGVTYSSSVFSVTGAITASGDITAYYSSDYRLKNNVKIIENASEKVAQLRGVEFDWNDKQSMYEGHDIGVIAQEVEAVAPEIVVTREDGYKAVNYQKLTALLIEAVKDLQEEIKELKKDK